MLSCRVIRNPIQRGECPWSGVVGLETVISPLAEHMRMPGGAGMAAPPPSPRAAAARGWRARRQALSLRWRSARTKGEAGGKKETSSGACCLLPIRFLPAARSALKQAGRAPQAAEGGGAALARAELE